MPAPTQRDRILEAVARTGRVRVSSLVAQLPDVPRESLSAQVRYLVRNGRLARVGQGEVEIPGGLPDDADVPRPDEAVLRSWMRTIRDAGSMTAWRLPDLVWEELDERGWIEDFYPGDDWRADRRVRLSQPGVDALDGGHPNPEGCEPGGQR